MTTSTDHTRKPLSCTNRIKEEKILKVHSYTVCVQKKNSEGEAYSWEGEMAVPSVTSQREGFLSCVFPKVKHGLLMTCVVREFDQREFWDYMRPFFTRFFLIMQKAAPKLTPPVPAPAAPAAPVIVACGPVVRRPAARAPWFHCCFKLKRKHHPLAFINANKYLSTKIAHGSDHK